MAWTKITDLLGAARVSAVGFSITTKGYVGLGTLSGNVKANDFWAYNSADGTWSQKANFPGVGRLGAVGFAIGTKGYVGLGRDSLNAYNDFYEYYPLINLWIRKTDFPAAARSLCVGFGIGAFGYIGLGEIKFNNTLTGEFWQFDPAGNGVWTLITAYPGYALSGSISFVINSKAYIGLGHIITGRVPYIYEFNPIGNVWTAKDNFGGGTRDYAIAFSPTGNKGYVGLGYGDAAPAGLKDDLWEFDPTLGAGSQWVKVSDFTGGARYAAVAFTIGTKGYAGTGNTGNIIQKDFYEFDPALLASVAQVLNLKWHILKASTPKDIVLKWDILDTSPISKSLILKWDIARYVFIPDVNLVLKWDILAEVQKSILLSWNINDKTPMSISKILKWDIRNYVEDNLVCKWDIEDKTFVSEDRIFKWDILGSTQKSINFKWDIYGLNETQDKTLICKWDIGKYIQKDLIAIWDIGDVSDVYPILILKWDIDDFASSPSQTLQCLWDIGGSIEKDLILKWDIFDVDGATGYVSDELSLQWDINGRFDITKQIVFKWHISATTISKDFIFRWDIENYVKKKIVFEWDIASMGKFIHEFESEKRNKTFKREIIRRKQLASDD